MRSINGVSVPRGGEREQSPDARPRPEPSRRGGARKARWRRAARRAARARAKRAIHSATSAKASTPAPSAIPRCARPITGSASKPASARKTKLKKKKWMAREHRERREPEAKTERAKSCETAAASIHWRAACRRFAMRSAVAAPSVIPCVPRDTRLLRKRSGYSQRSPKKSARKAPRSREKSKSASDAFARIEKLDGPAELGEDASRAAARRTR